MTTPKILAFAGSARTDSFNKKLVKIAAEGAKAAGAEVTYLDFRDLPLPLYDGDLEAAGLPANVLTLKSMMRASDGFLIACPEYNSSITPLLKNALDWASRPEPQDPQSGRACFRDKVAVIMSTSPGGLGGLQGLAHVRAILVTLGVLVLPDHRSVPNAHQAFNEDGNLVDEKQRSDIYSLGSKLTTVLNKLI